MRARALNVSDMPIRRSALPFALTNLSSRHSERECSRKRVKNNTRFRFEGKRVLFLLWLFEIVAQLLRSGGFACARFRIDAINGLVYNVKRRLGRTRDMDDVLTIAEIESRFASEWVLIEDPQTNQSLEVQRGTVRWHSQDRDEIYRKMIELRLKRSAVLFTGAIPEDTAIVL